MNPDNQGSSNLLQLISIIAILLSAIMGGSAKTDNSEQKLALFRTTPASVEASTVQPVQSPTSPYALTSSVNGNPSSDPAYGASTDTGTMRAARSLAAPSQALAQAQLAPASAPVSSSVAPSSLKTPSTAPASSPQGTNPNSFIFANKGAPTTLGTTTNMPNAAPANPLTTGVQAAPSNPVTTGVQGAPPSGNKKTAKFTYYWIFNPKDGEGNLNPNSEMVPLLDDNNQEIAKVPLDYAKRYAMEGTGLLEDGRLINLSKGKEYPDARFIVLDKSVAPWGYGSNKNPLTPFKSIAANDLPRGTKVYIPILAGKRMPDGSVHDGYCIVDDESWSFSGDHVDFFAGTYVNYQALSKQLGIDSQETEIIVVQ